MRLPVFLCWLLCAAGVTVSSSAAWVLWLGTHSPTKERLLKILPLAEALGLPASTYWVQLADLMPDQEETFLRSAIRSNPRELKAILRLALIVEFKGDRNEAKDLMDQATTYHHSFKSYMAALTQAARWQDSARVEQFASLALVYCPRDADGIFSQLSSLAVAERVLAGAGEKWRADYLRFLVSQSRLKEAMAMQQKLGRSPLLDKYRLELSDRLFWAGQREEAAELFSILHPGFASDGVFNAELRSRPSSLGFDWRLSQHEKTRLNWRPGEVEVQVGKHFQALELMSILVEARNRPVQRVVPSWGGETDGLYWQMNEFGPKWRRVVLIAPPGDRDRRFRLMAVKFE